ncbi:MAG: hypothetical protein KKA61_02455 [Nanoarchaeota archaeon]|nr:hypothetical protein [Nanoarchaeota archaeon]MBU4284271.1 hypothetical protein [Nanoarchaeota archaeon]MBU4493207.1 hypothetical protein [Nanoarchaeota archaeon]
MVSQALEQKLSSVPGKEKEDRAYQTQDVYTGDQIYAEQTKPEEIMKVINEAVVKPDTIELTPTRRLGLDACGCTGNGSCN